MEWLSLELLYGILMLLIIKMHNMAVCLMFFLKYRKGEYDDEMSLLGLVGI